MACKVLKGRGRPSGMALESQPSAAVSGGGWSWTTVILPPGPRVGSSLPRGLQERLRVGGNHQTRDYGVIYVIRIYMIKLLIL